jgi:hypothetical protein
MSNNYYNNKDNVKGNEKVTEVSKDQKNDKEEQNEKDAEVILEDGQKVILCGKKYTLRRLNVKDVFAFSKLLSKSAKDAMLQIADINNVDTNMFAFLLMEGLADNQSEVAETYGSFISMKGEDFLTQPPEFFDQFLAVIKEQYDLKSFFTTVLKTIQSLGSLWQTR